MCSIIFVSLFWASTLAAHEMCAGPEHGCAGAEKQQAVSDHCKKAAKKTLQPAAASCDCAHLEVAMAELNERVDAAVAEPATLAVLPLAVSAIGKCRISIPVAEPYPKADALYLRHQRFLI